MEKRFIIAVMLSLLVLMGWNMLTGQYNQDPSLKNITQDIENNEVMKNSDEAVSDYPVDDVAEDIAEEGEVTVLETSNLTLEISNMGAQIKRLYLNEYEKEFPLTNVGGWGDLKRQSFSVVSKAEDKIVYVASKGGVEIRRTYLVDGEGYTVIVSNVITNRGGETFRLGGETSSLTIDTSRMDKEKGISKDRDKSLYEYAVSHDSEITRKNKAFKFNEKENEYLAGAVNWVGFRDRYFSTIFRSDLGSKGALVKVLDENSLKIGIDYEEISVGPGEEFAWDDHIFSGPEEMALLKQAHYSYPKFKRYYRFGLFDAIAKIIEGMMHLLHRVIKSWGLCIVLTSVIVYFSMYPLTLKSMQSMKKMQALQPKIQKLKDKHKDNPQKLNQEMMEIYKQERINPLGGCLPILFQMPVFIGLYQVLWRSVEFKGASFLWIDDLSEPDKFIALPNSYPFIGDEINLLPLLMIGIMFVQSRLQAKNMVVTDPAQQAQQKMMQRIMPIFLGVIFYKFASGLTLYFTMFYLFSTFTQWKMSLDKK